MLVVVIDNFIILVVEYNIVLVMFRLVDGFLLSDLEIYIFIFYDVVFFRVCVEFFVLSC